MGRSQESWNKKEAEKKKKKKKKDKEQKKLERKINPDGKSFDDMIAYVDEFGQITSEPPEENSTPEEDDSTKENSSPDET